MTYQEIAKIIAQLATLASDISTIEEINEKGNTTISFTSEWRKNTSKFLEEAADKLLTIIPEEHVPLFNREIEVSPIESVPLLNSNTFFDHWLKDRNAGEQT